MFLPFGHHRHDNAGIATERHACSALSFARQLVGRRRPTIAWTYRVHNKLLDIPVSRHLEVTSYLDDLFRRAPLKRPVATIPSYPIPSHPIPCCVECPRSILVYLCFWDSRIKSLRFAPVVSHDDLSIHPQLGFSSLLFSSLSFLLTFGLPTGHRHSFPFTHIKQFTFLVTDAYTLSPSIAAASSRSALPFINQHPFSRPGALHSITTASVIPTSKRQDV